MVGILWHDDFLDHIPRADHPESPERVSAIVDELGKDVYRDALVWDVPRLAGTGEIGYVHDAGYIARVAETAGTSSVGYLDPDTPVSSGSYRAALRAAGAVITAIDGVLDRQYRRAFCPVRPPGHHARSGEAMGFCIFNSIAIGARYLRRRHGIGEILIVDFDVHHCNGTEEMLSDDDGILLCSIHQSPHYPGTGLTSRLSRGSGVLNVPVPPGSGEAAFMDVITGRLAGAVALFRPEFVLVSAGFDAHHADPLGNLALESDSYFRITREIVRFADTYCDGRVVSVLEGGYDLPALAESAGMHVRAIMEG